MIPPRFELASGPGWRVLDVVCSAGPEDPREQEQFDVVNVALVMEGTFQYRTAQGSSTLAPGGVVLGNHGACFECGHDHGVGDRCLAFHFAPDVFAEVVAVTPGMTTTRFSHASLPPLHCLAPIFAAAESARDARDRGALEETALEAASRIAVVASDLRTEAVQASARDLRRVSDALRRIEEAPDEDLGLDALSREAEMSRYHFLRVFRQVAGVTPYQFVLRQRLHRAAVRIRSSGDPISTIAFDAGFGDLSTFNRRFKRIMGASPSTYRARSAT